MCHIRSTADPLNFIRTSFYDKYSGPMNITNRFVERGEHEVAHHLVPVRLLRCQHLPSRTKSTDSQSWHLVQMWSNRRTDLRNSGVPQGESEVCKPSIWSRSRTTLFPSTSCEASTCHSTPSFLEPLHRLCQLLAETVTGFPKNSS